MDLPTTQTPVPDLATTTAIVESTPTATARFFRQPIRRDEFEPGNFPPQGICTSLYYRDQGLEPTVTVQVWQGCSEDMLRCCPPGDTTVSDGWELPIVEECPPGYAECPVQSQDSKGHTGQQYRGRCCPNGWNCRNYFGETCVSHYPKFILDATATYGNETGLLAQGAPIETGLNAVFDKSFVYSSTFYIPAKPPALRISKAVLAGIIVCVVLLLGAATCGCILWRKKRKLARRAKEGRERQYAANRARINGADFNIYELERMQREQQRGRNRSPASHQPASSTRSLPITTFSTASSQARLLRPPPSISVRTGAGARSTMTASTSPPPTMSNAATMTVTPISSNPSLNGEPTGPPPTYDAVVAEVERGRLVRPPSNVSATGIDGDEGLAVGVADGMNYVPGQGGPTVLPAGVH